jgi:hypothetical protein
MSQRLTNLISLPELLITICAFFAPVGPLVIVVGLFIAVDTIFGLYKAHRLKEKITSDKAARGVGAKLILYTGSVVMVFLLEKFIIGDIVNMFVNLPFLATKIVALSFCLIEIKSLDEKFVKIYGYSLVGRCKELIMKLKQTKDELKD